MSELEELYEKQNMCYAKKQQYEDSRAVIEKKIQRLEETKNKVRQIKELTKEEKDRIKDAMKEASDWKGNLKDKAEDIHDSDIMRCYKIYYTDIDTVLDLICDEITRLENENRDLGWLLNGVLDTLNNIGNAIEKLVN